MKPTDIKLQSHGENIGMVEAGLARLDKRLPGLPVNDILLCRLLMFLGRDMVAMLDHYIRPVGLAEAEFRVLMMLLAQPDGVAHPSELCARAAQSPANMSRINDELVRRDLITRVPSAQDRRRMVLRITAAGEALVRSLLPTLFAPLRDLFSEFSDTDQLQLIAQLKRMAIRFDQVTRLGMAEHPL
jgi:MarR family transcriptional repressor of emrRAB